MEVFFTPQTTQHFNCVILEEYCNVQCMPTHFFLFIGKHVDSNFFHKYIISHNKYKELEIHVHAGADYLPIFIRSVESEN